MASLPSLFTRGSESGSSDDSTRRFRAGERGVEWYETDDELVLELEMPGFEPDDIDVVWHDDRVTVGAHSDEYGDERVVHRTFELHRDVDESAIDATYRNGVLELRFPIAGATPSSGRSIPVEGSS